jgi:hypothetical protein
MVTAPPTTWPEAVEVVGIWFACALIVWAIAWWAVKK